MSMLRAQRIRVTKCFHFEMAHALSGHDGACAHVHGHSYALEVTVLGVPIDDPASSKNGMVIDFTDLKAIVQRRVVDHYDHALVLHESERSAIDTDHPLFGRTHFTAWQPTCENLLLDMIARIRSEFPAEVELSHARLQETATSWAEWHVGDR